MLLSNNKQWVCFHHPERKIYINGIKLSSNDLCSQSATIEIFSYLIHHQWRRIDNKQLPTSSYSRSKNQFMSKIIIPFKKIIKKILWYDVQFYHSGNTYEFTMMMWVQPFDIHIITKDMKQSTIYWTSKSLQTKQNFAYDTSASIDTQISTKEKSRLFDIINLIDKEKRLFEQKRQNFSHQDIINYLPQKIRPLLAIIQQNNILPLFEHYSRTKNVLQFFETFGDLYEHTLNVSEYTNIIQKNAYKKQNMMQFALHHRKMGRYDYRVDSRCHRQKMYNKEKMIIISNFPFPIHWIFLAEKNIFQTIEYLWNYKNNDYHKTIHSFIEQSPYHERIMFTHQDPLHFDYKEADMIRLHQTALKEKTDGILQRIAATKKRETKVLTISYWGWGSLMRPYSQQIDTIDYFSSCVSKKKYYWWWRNRRDIFQ